MTTLILHPDLDCEVYVDTELHGLARAGEEYIISLERGAYWVECVSAENSANRTNFDFRTDGSNFTEHHDVKIKPMRYKRLISQYDFVGEFRCGFAEVKKNGKAVGYINRDGDVIYDNAIPFGEDKLCVCKDNLWGILNIDGNYIVNPQYHKMQPIESGPAIINIDERYGLISSNGNIVVETKYDKLFKVAGENLIICKLNNKYGLIDYDGIKITPLKYDQINFWSGDGLIGVSFNDKCGFINNKGNISINIKYDDVTYKGEGLIIAKFHNKTLLINRDGEEITSLPYDYIGNFCEGIARVRIGAFRSGNIDNCQWGYIDNKGKEIVPLKYNYAASFVQGIAKVIQNGEKFRINRDGVKVKDGWD